MLKVTITLEGKQDSDIENALNEVKRLLSEGYKSGFNKNESSNFNFSTEGEEEESTCVCSKCGQDFVLNEDGTTNHLIEDSEGVDDIDHDQDEDHAAFE
jgi:hypothetical protein